MARGKTTPPKEPQQPSLVVPRAEAADQITKQIAKGKEIKNFAISKRQDLEQAWTQHTKWTKYNAELLGRLFDNDSIAREYNRSGLGVWKPDDEVGNFHGEMQSRITGLEAILERLELIPESIEISATKESAKQTSESALKRIEHLCRRFHIIARQLRSRHDDRETLNVEDEYDTQDLLHALLAVYFDDIRTEEWTPSYAGGSSRMDFLLKQEQIVIEVKKTRKGLAAREIGEQLIIDIVKYQNHSDCRTLICFVYDSEMRIPNPRGIENDLNRTEGDLTVKVIIVPTGM
jgi:hypothetical protein